MAIQIQIRRDTASNWSSNNPTLAIGELGFVTDTSQLKIGNGSTAWNSLPYFLNSASATTAEIAAAVAGLIDLSPATLDTLNELAAAIGDDANFFQTIGASVTSASAYALSQANSYTDTEVAEAIVTASAAAVAYADGLTTSDVAEGTNLYFTNQRAIDAASATYILQTNQQGIINSASAAAASYADGLAVNYDAVGSASAAVSTHNLLLSGVHGISGSVVGTSDTQILTNKTIDGANNTLSNIPNNALVNDSIFINNFEINLGGSAAYSSDNINEGTVNLYFTPQRSIDAASATYILQTSQQGIINTASAAAVASSNSYTDTEVAEAIVTASAAAVAYADGLTTSDVAEGTNLYFTDQRAVNAGSATYILQSNQQGIINTASAAAASYTDGAITSLIDSAPGALNTLNELAAALGDDANFASTIINVVSSASANSISSANSYTDTEVAEAIVTASAAAVAYADGLTTSDVAEGTNLYFTNQRAIDAASATYILQTNQQGIINTASAAAVAYADGLTTTDISEGTSLYYTNVRGLETASTALVHANHIGLSASYTSGEIRFTVTEIDGGGV